VSSVFELNPPATTVSNHNILVLYNWVNSCIFAVKMSTQITYKFRKAFAFALLVLIGLLTTNNTFFQHFHKLYNGQVISHAHPLSNSTSSDGSASHNHSNAELLALNTLSILFFTAIFSAVFTQVYKLYPLRKLTPLFLNRFDSNSQSNRAPPSN
jgi:hypothetical protein